MIMKIQCKDFCYMLPYYNCSMMKETEIEKTKKKVWRIKTLEWEDNCRCHKLLQHRKHRKAQNEEN